MNNEEGILQKQMDILMNFRDIATKQQARTAKTIINTYGVEECFSYMLDCIDKAKLRAS